MVPQGLAFDAEIQHRQVSVAQVRSNELIEVGASKRTVGHEAKKLILYILANKRNLSVGRDAINAACTCESNSIRRARFGFPWLPRP
jgi:hypothetical protein